MKSLSYVFSVRKSIFLALAALLGAGCSHPEGGEDTPVGTLRLNMGISVQSDEVYSNLKAAEPDEFVVLIRDESGNEVLSYARADEVPPSIELPEGSYYVVAHSNNNLPAAFENDYYYGESALFTITAGETTQVSLTCVLANIMVSVIYAPTVISDFDSYQTTVSNAEGSLVFAETEIRPGYFDQGPLAIVADLGYTDESGTVQTLTLTGNIIAPEVGKHYEIYINASLSEGHGSIELIVDESYETELVEINDDEPGMSGELLISEIMYNPSAVTDTEGEYIEVKNVSGETQNLMDLVIRRGSTNDIHVITADLPLLPGEIALLGRSASAAAEVDYVYSTISLLNSGDVIFLNHYGTDGTNGDVICSVDYGATGFATSLNGASIQLNPGITDATLAMQGTNWCPSGSAFITGDYGTPGEENLECP